MSTKYGKYSYKGPWIIQEVHNNGTVKISKGSVLNVYNICNINTMFFYDVTIMNYSAKISYIN